MNIYRCTRRKPYESPGCPGHMDKSARQGHYIEAESRDEAIQKMAKQYPDEVVPGFDIQLWEENIR